MKKYDSPPFYMRCSLPTFVIHNYLSLLEVADPLALPFGVAEWLTSGILGPGTAYFLVPGSNEDFIMTNDRRAIGLVVSNVELLGQRGASAGKWGLVGHLAEPSSNVGELEGVLHAESDDLSHVDEVRVVDLLADGASVTFTGLGGIGSAVVAPGEGRETILSTPLVGDFEHPIAASSGWSWLWSRRWGRGWLRLWCRLWFRCRSWCWSWRWLRLWLRSWSWGRSGGWLRLRLVLVLLCVGLDDLYDRRSRSRDGAFGHVYGDDFDFGVVDEVTLLNFVDGEWSCES